MASLLEGSIGLRSRENALVGGRFRYLGAKGLGAVVGILLQPLRSVPCSLSFVEKSRMVMMAKSESNSYENPNISNKKIRIDTVSAFERRYTFFNGYK